MATIVNVNDFTGKLGISQKKPFLNGTDVTLDLSNFIDRHEEKILFELLGSSVLAQLKVVPMDAIFLPLLSPLSHNGRYSFGLKEMLKCFIYFEYNRSGMRNTTVGQVKAKSDVSDSVSAINDFNMITYNEAVTSYNVISGYLQENKDLVFPDLDQLVPRQKYMTL